MNETNTATYDVYDRKMRLASKAIRPGVTSRRYRRLPTAYSAANPSNPAVEADRQVREDKGFYIPDLLADSRYDSNPEGYSAAVKHAIHLRKAEGLLNDAYNLVLLLSVSLGDEGDSRAMQIATALKVIEKKLGKASTRIDKHDARHTNLFLAYFDLREQAGEGKKN